MKLRSAIFLLVPGLMISTQTGFAQVADCHDRVTAVSKKFIEGQKDVSKQMDNICVNFFGSASKECNETSNKEIKESSKKAFAKYYYQSHDLKEIEKSQVWTNQFIANIKTKSDQFWPLSPVDKEKIRKNRQSEYWKILKDPNLQQALLLNNLLSDAQDQCKALHEVGFKCVTEISLDDFVNFINRKKNEILNNASLKHSQTPDDSFMFELMNSIGDITRFVKDYPIYDPPGLEIERVEEDNQEKLNITILARKGDGFESDEQFEKFFNRMKKQIEGFWKGDVTVEDKKISIQTRLELSESSKAILIRIPPETEMDPSAGAGFNPKDNQFLFRKETIDNEKKSDNQAILHEVGHALGFDERYHRVRLGSSCEIAPFAQPGEVMDALLPGTADLFVQPDELKFLYMVYGAQRQNRIGFLLKDFEKEVDEYILKPETK